jgi:hypothetical protein
MQYGSAPAATTASLVHLEPEAGDKETRMAYICWFSLHLDGIVWTTGLCGWATPRLGCHRLSAPEKIRLGMRLPGLQRVYDSWWRMVESDCEPSCVHLERRHELHEQGCR